jgi:hypothetical protein
MIIPTEHICKILRWCLHRADAFSLKSFNYNQERILKDRGLEDGGIVQKFIDSECLRLTAPFVPKDTGGLIESGTINTKIGSGEVIYNTPYARRWYYMPAQFQGAPQRGNYWFTRMAQQYKAKILDGAKKLAGVE